MPFQVWMILAFDFANLRNDISSPVTTIITFHINVIQSTIIAYSKPFNILLDLYYFLPPPYNLGWSKSI